jgi:hypothetical protein
MKNLKRVLPFYLTFILLNIAIISLYSLFNWYYIIENKSITVLTDYSDYWIPICFTLITSIIVYGITLKKEKPGILGLILIGLLMLFLICPPLLIIQRYIQTNSGKITTLEQLGQLTTLPKTKYYNLKKYYVDKSNTGIAEWETPDSRFSLGYYIYLASPIIANQADTLHSNYNYWLTKRYYTSFGRFDSDEIRRKKKVFWDKSIKDFENTNLNDFKFIGVLDRNADNKNFEIAAQNSKYFKSTEENYFFEAFTVPYENRNGGKMYWIIGVLIFNFSLYFLIVYYYVRYLDKIREDVRVFEEMLNFKKKKKNSN